MFSTVAVFKMDPSRSETQQRELAERVVPLTRHQPGFVSGTWNYDEQQSRYLSHLVWATERDARGFAEFLIQNRARDTSSGVVFESITVAKVMATA